MALGHATTNFEQQHPFSAKAMHHQTSTVTLQVCRDHQAPKMVRDAIYKARVAKQGKPGHYFANIVHV